MDRRFYTGEQFRELKCNFNAFFFYKDICAEFIYVLLYMIYFYFTLLYSLFGCFTVYLGS